MIDRIADMLDGRDKVILVHTNADMDAVGSAYAISKAFPPARICALNGIDKVTTMVSEKLGIEYITEFDPNGCELVVIVDTSSPDQLGADIEIPKGSIVIDHHLPTEKWTDMEFYCDNKKVSCCEIAYEIVKSKGIALPKDALMALLGGMLTDSGHFQHANPALLRAFSEILEVGGIYMDEAIMLTRSSVSVSERVAMLKTIGRLKFDRVGDMLVSVSSGGSFEASSCRSMMISGADVAFVGSQRMDEFRLSARATQDIVRRGIHLGDILADIGRETDNDGGGHGGAAGISGKGDIDAILSICMSRTMEEFRKIKEREGCD